MKRGLPPGRCFMEHKQLMLLRLRTLHEKGFLQNAELIDAYETLAQDAAWLFNLTFKYTLAPASAPLKKIHDHVAAINQREPRADPIAPFPPSFMAKIVESRLIWSLLPCPWHGNPWD